MSLPTSPSTGQATEVRHVVLTVHGIRTFGRWAERLAALIAAQRPDILSLRYNYGYFSAIAFFLPPLRWLAIFWFARELRALAQRYPGARVDIVCHSFGTHLVGWALRSSSPKELPEVHTVIMAGSVLRRRFRWTPLFQRGKPVRVVNDCGIHDNILILSQLFVLFTGMAGRIGFDGVLGHQLVNRFHTGGHSLYFTDDFMARLWLPLLVTSVPPLGHDGRDPHASSLSGVLLWAIQNSEALKLGVYVAIPIWLALSYLHERDLAFAVGLAAQADSMLSTSGDANVPGLLLAIESYKRSPSEDGRRALRSALAKLPQLRAAARLTTTVSDLSLDHEGRWLLVGTDDGKALVFDTDTMRPGAGVGSATATALVGISRDGRKNYAVDALGNGSMWNRANGEPLLTLEHGGPVLAGAFSSDGSRLLTVSRVGFSGGTVLQAWRTDDARLLSSTELESAEVTAVALSPDATLVATARDAPSGLDEAIRVWDTETTTEIARHRSNSTVSVMAFNSDAELMAVGDQQGTIRVLPTRGRRAVAEMHSPGPIVLLRFGRNESEVPLRGSASIRDLISDDSMQRALDSGFSLVPPGLFLASVAGGKTVTMWEAVTGREIASLVHEDDVDALVFGPYDRTVVTASHDALQIWHALPDHFDLMRLNGAVKALAFGKGANSVLALDEQGIYRAWNRASGRPIGQFELFMMPSSSRPRFRIARFGGLPGGIFVAGTTDTDSSRLLLWEGTSGVLFDMHSFEGFVEALAVSVDGTRIAVGLDDGAVHLLDTPTRRVLRQFRMNAAATSLALTDDGQWLVAGAADGAVRLWSAETGQEGFGFTYPASIAVVAVSSTRNWIAAIDATGNVSVRDRAGNEVRRLNRNEPITAAAIGNDGLLAIGGRRVEVIDLQTGVVLADQSVADAPSQLLFAPDAQRLFIANRSTVEAWLWDPQKLIDEGCARATRNLTRAEWEALLPGKPYRETCPTLRVLPRPPADSSAGSSN